MTRLSLETENPPSLLAPTRMDVFATRKLRTGKRGKVRSVDCGWQAWNADPVMEDRMSRLPGSGSFYWPNAWRAYLAAKGLMAADPTIHQIKIETIGGREIARVL